MLDLDLLEVLNGQELLHGELLLLWQQLVCHQLLVVQQVLGQRRVAVPDWHLIRGLNVLILHYLMSYARRIQL